MLSAEVDEVDAHAVLCEAGLIDPMGDPSRRDMNAALSKLLFQIFRKRDA